MRLLRPKRPAVVAAVVALVAVPPLFFWLVFFLLLSHWNPNSNKCPTPGQGSDSGIIQAAIDGNTAALRAHLPSDRNPAHRANALGCAATEAQTSTVRILLDANVDPNLSSTYAGRPLIAAVSGRGENSPNAPTAEPDPAVSNPQRIVIVALMLAHGAHPGPALRPAAEGASAATVKELLDYGANPNGEPHQSSPLASATYFGNQPVAALLLARGANPNGGGSPDYSAAAIGALVHRLQLGLHSCPFLTATTTTSPTSAGVPPLVAAVIMDRTNIIRLLLTYHANPRLGHPSAVEAALECGDPVLAKLLSQSH